MPEQKINTQVDFDHAQQLVEAKMQSMVNELRSFSKEQGLNLGFILSFEIKNPVPISETDEHIEVQEIKGAFSNAENLPAALLSAAMTMLENNIIHEPKQNDDPKEALRRAVEVLSYLNINKLKKLTRILDMAEGLAPIIGSLDLIDNLGLDRSNGKKDTDEVIRQAMQKMRAQ